MKRWKTVHDKMSDSWQDDSRGQDYREQMTNGRGGEGGEMGDDKLQYNRWQDDR